MKLSIVTTLYNSAPYIEEFHQRATAAAKKFTTSYEIIFVNDGSPDNALALAVALHEIDEKVKVIDLSRNFGHHKAMMTGLTHASGEHVFLIDSDLEEEPELLSVFWEKLEEENSDVVYGVQEKRRGGLFERLSGGLFYWMAFKLADIKLPRNMSTVRLMTKRYVKSLISHKEHEIVISGLWIATGYKQVFLTIPKTRVRKGSYGFLRKVNLATDFLTAFSGRLLYFVFYLGLLISSLAFCYIAYTITHYFLHGPSVGGWTSLIASVWLLGGLMILFIGLIGIYIARIFNETKNRPYTVIRHIYKNEGGNPDEITWEKAVG